MRPFLMRAVNALALLSFVLMVSTGSVLRWVLPPGSGRPMGGGLGRMRPVLSLGGLDRHEWSEVHFYVSLTFLAILLVHLVLHWGWIRATAWGSAQSPQPAVRRLLTAGIVLFILAALLFPWLMPVKVLGE